MTTIELRRPAKILFPVDFSRASINTSRLVKAIAGHFKSGVTLVHVLEPPSHPFELFEAGFSSTMPVDAAARALSEFAQEDFAGLDYQIQVLEGDAAGRIVDFARSHGTDLIVISTRGHGRFRRMLLGSVSAKILHDAEMPVLTGVHLEDAVVDQAIHIRKVLCALDYDARAFAALRAAALLAGEFAAKLTAVHAIHGQDRSQSLEGERQARELIENLAVDCEVVAESGQPATVVSQAAKRLPADVIVIGRSEPTPVGRLKSQAYGIIRDSPCPVLSV